MASKGVRIKIAKDKKTLTVWAHPIVSGQSDKLTKSTWKNYCTSCKSHGNLDLLTSKSSKSPYYGGALRCKRCGKVFCAVTGWTEDRKLKLIPATRTANEATRIALSEVETNECTITKAQALTKAKKKLKTTDSFKATLEIPILPNIRTGDRLEIKIKGFGTKTKFIDSIKENIDKQTYTISLISGTTNYGNRYSGKYIIFSQDGKVLAQSSKNPLKAKCSKVNTNTGIKANSMIAKKIMLKGQKLGSIDKCYKWLKVTSGGGTGGWKYLSYANHTVSSEEADKWGDKSAEACWKRKKANCCDFSWLFTMLTRGAGKPAGIMKGTYTGLDGVKRGHMWNYYKSKYYDCSSIQLTTIDLKKQEQVKKDGK